MTANDQCQTWRAKTIPTQPDQRPWESGGSPEQELRCIKALNFQRLERLGWRMLEGLYGYNPPNSGTYLKFFVQHA